MWLKILAVLLGVIIGYGLIDNFDPDSLRGKRVVITGASTGIGEQMAYHYARLGAHILITARREAALKQLKYNATLNPVIGKYESRIIPGGEKTLKDLNGGAEEFWTTELQLMVIERCREVGQPGGEYHYITADMEHMNATDKVIQEAVRILGGIDYLVLNHIVVHRLGRWEGSPENLTQFHKIIDVNFKAYVHLATHAMPHLESSHGSIIVLSSIAGKLGQPYVASYSASKFALDGFFSSLRQELILRGSDVSITLCVIGLIGTENAINQLLLSGRKFLVETLIPAAPSDAAYAIMKGGALRQWEMYFPYLTSRMVTLSRDLVPQTLAAINRYFFR